MDEFTLLQENERLKNELAEAKAAAEHFRRQVMMAINLRFHLMPNSFPVFNDLPEADVYADQIGMAQTGGDFFDIIRIDADHIGLLVADVYDGGDAAALFMVTFKLYLQGELAMGFPIEHLMQVVNNRLSRSNEDNVSLSAWFGIYEASTGKLSAVNAGQEPPIVLRQAKALVCPEDEPSYLMGIMEGISYESYEITLEPGDAIIVSTDGLFSAKNQKGENFSKQLLTDTIEKSGKKDAGSIIADIQAALIGFIGEEVLEDDVTTLCLKRAHK